jgi:HAD superfamily hydrolase (TIGR01509 family)
MEEGDAWMVRAVFFDLFETLITEFADGKRLSQRKYDYKALLGIENAVFKHEWSLRSEQRMRGHYPNFHSVMEDILAAHEMTCAAETIDHLYQERRQEKLLPFQQIDPRMFTLLQALKDRGLRLGLISNCTEEEICGWQDSELSTYFDSVIFSYDAAIAKPDVRIYQLGCSQLGVKPEEAIFVGDGGSNELEGAANAGMRPLHAFWYNTYVESPYPKLLQPEDLLRELS